MPKLMEYTRPRVNHNVENGFGVIMMYQCRLIDCNKYTILAGCIW